MSVIETQTFRLLDGVAVEAFLDADRRVQTELMLRKPAFLRRTTARSADGDWLVVVLWGSESDADTASLQFRNDPANAAFVKLLDERTVRTTRYATLD